MRHMYKLFTHEEATRLLPVVDQHLAEMQRAVQETLTLRGELSQHAALSVTAQNLAREIAFVLSEIHRHKAELDRLGVHLKDVETGVVDFPSKLGAEVVCLSWERGQDAITHYHRLGNEDEIRPLPDRAPSAVAPL